MFFTLIAMETGARLSAFARDVRAGLTSTPKHLSCCFFYDREGSQLFEEICELPEYYLPGAERAILQAHAADIVSAFSAEVDVVELGSGNAAKTRILLEAFLAGRSQLRYVPIDICRTVLEETARELLREYPGLEIVAVAGEYQEGLRHLAKADRRRRLILWLGSNVGNFHRDEAAAFLARIRATMGPDDRLLVGIDLRKDKTTLERAYDDSLGVTARFNLNLLTRINRELDGHFDLDSFRHRAVYDEQAGRIEMYLDSQRDQEVAIDRIPMDVHFSSGEPIHTENSYKYSRAEIETLAHAAGLRIEQQWLDADKLFSETLMKV